MGCSSSTPAKAVVDAAPRDAGPAAVVKKREREITGQTEAMAVGGAPSDHPADTTADTNPASASTSSSAGSAPAAPSASAVLASAPPFKPSVSASCRVGDLPVRYACLSRRGRDPDDPSKPNQDCYGDHYNPSSAFFAVYDGHGPKGKECSHFVRGRLPKLLKENLVERRRQGNTSISVEDVHASLHDSHVDCNEELRKSEINDTQSGTTSVGVFIHDDNQITVTNVGDSRIVLGTASGNSSSGIQAVPLSKDHTPHREDEAARCIESGARILSFGQIDPSTADDDDDDVEDPPRVWSREGHYPGTAFTRSIGDSVAERLGVYAEPELLTLPVSSDERFLVLASDGVFDVVSNQEVVNICHRYGYDPAKACEAVLDRSHEEWLRNDDCCEEEANYDDMTCVVVYFDHPGVAYAPPESGTSPQRTREEHRQGKRVRQKTLRNLEEMAE